MAKYPVSPLAPAAFPEMPAVAGVELATCAAGVRYQGRHDVLLARFAPGTSVAGVFTRNSMPGAPVDWCRRHIGNGTAGALLVNSGNANVFTGRDGADAVAASAQSVADRLGIAPEAVMVASTGVIGEKLRHERIQAAIDGLVGDLAPGRWPDAAATIATTDTYPKGASATARLDGRDVAIVGIAKGSGMIQPDMATMLSFLFTDAALPSAVLQPMLAQVVGRTYNCITVDSDTSTSDTVLLFATGQSGAGEGVERLDHPRLRDFRRKLEDVARDLALQVVKDGEGAQKLVTIEVTGATSAMSARRIGFAIANSPLVKTAIAGADANWGRIVMAVGKSGERADRDRLSIRIGEVEVAERGHASPTYREADLAPYMKGRDIRIAVDVGVGRGRATVWTCDLTHGYIDINADYRS